jgi:hypothetical protein
MEANLRSLDNLFQRAKTQKQALFYSKLAILELCGWIEESMDDVILRCASRCVKVAANRDYVSKQIVKRTYGFDYDKHFREMMIRVVGMSAVEKIERKVDATKQAQLKATLGALVAVRNAEAHTHVKGVTKSINAPSATMKQFVAAYEGLREYEKAIRKAVRR